MSPTPPMPKLTPEFLAMITRGVSVIVSGCGPDLTPSLMRGVGSLIEGQGERVTVFLNRTPSAQLLRDIAATGRVAVVFSEPSSHRTVQLKARSGVRIREAREHDLPALQRYAASMAVELSRVGLGPEFAAAMLAYRFDDLVALSFSPEEAYDQTPGPRAGQPITRAQA